MKTFNISKPKKIILIILVIIAVLAISNPSLKSFCEAYNYDYKSHQGFKLGNYFIFSTYRYSYPIEGHPGRWGNNDYIGILGNFFEYRSFYPTE